MRIPKLCVLLTCVVAFGCGGGGGGGGTDLNGWWELSLRPTTGGAYGFAFLGPAAHSGSDVVYIGIDLTFDGTTLAGADPDFASAHRTELHLDFRSADLLEGQVHGIAPATPTTVRDARLRRVPRPTGTFTAVGNAGGAPVDIHSRTAFAVVSETPVGGGSSDYVLDIVDMHPAMADGIRLSLRLATLLIFPVERNIPAGCTLYFTLTDDSFTATNGTVVFTHFAASDRVRGSYQVILGLDGTVEGTFDVPVLGTR